MLLRVGRVSWCHMVDAQIFYSRTDQDFCFLACGFFFTQGLFNFAFKDWLTSRGRFSNCSVHLSSMQLLSDWIGASLTHVPSSGQPVNMSDRLVCLFILTFVSRHYTVFVLVLLYLNEHLRMPVQVTYYELKHIETMIIVGWVKKKWIKHLTIAENSLDKI